MSQILNNNEPTATAVINRATINSILEVLGQSLKNDLNLTTDLLVFLANHNIELPALTGCTALAPECYQYAQNADNSINLKHSFEGNHQGEFLL